MDLEPEWKDAVLDNYEIVGYQLDGAPEAYAAIGVRRDIVARVRSSGPAP